MLHEHEALRVARAVNHARAQLMAGFTSARDLGTEGAGYADVGLRDAIAQGIIPGPRMWASTKAIVVTGQYAPKGFATEYMNDIPQGAEEANGVEGFIRVVRDQIKHGADWIKIYADYRWGPNGEAMPGPTLEEFTAAVNVAKGSGRNVAAHASTAEGMRRATLAGVATIEHGDSGTPEVFRLMAERGVCYVPTVSVGGRNKQQVLKYAVDAGVTICNGADSGPVAHGDNAREARRPRDERPHAASGASSRNGQRREDARDGRPPRRGEDRLSRRSHRRARRSDEGHFGDPSGAAGNEGRDGLQAAVAGPLSRPFRSGKCCATQVG